MLNIDGQKARCVENSPEHYFNICSYNLKSFIVHDENVPWTIHKKFQRKKEGGEFGKGLQLNLGKGVRKMLIIGDKEEEGARGMLKITDKKREVSFRCQ